MAIGACNIIPSKHSKCENTRLRTAEAPPCSRRCEFIRTTSSYLTRSREASKKEQSFFDHELHELHEKIEGLFIRVHPRFQTSFPREARPQKILCLYSCSSSHSCHSCSAFSNRKGAKSAKEKIRVIRVIRGPYLAFIRVHLRQSAKSADKNSLFSKSV